MDASLGLVTVLRNVRTDESTNVSALLAARPVVVIGSDARAHLQLAGKEVEAAHAILTRKGEDVYVAPRTPTALVKVNGRPVKTPYHLQAGDVIAIGSSELRCDLHEGLLVAAPAPPSAAALAARTPAPRPVVTPAPATAAAIREVLPDVGRQVHYPAGAAAASGRMSLSSLFTGIALIVVVTSVIIFAIVTNSSNQQAAAGRLEALIGGFAYDDGNATVLMFDADW